MDSPYQNIPNDACWRLYQGVALACRDAGDLPSLLTTALNFCLQLRDVDAGCVHRVDPDGSLSLVSQSGFEAKDARILNASVDADVAKTGQPVYVQRGDPELEGDALFTALATLPVVFDKRVFAVLTLASRKVEVLPEPIRAVLETIAAQLAPALANMGSTGRQSATREATDLESVGVLAGGVARGLHHLLVSADLQADRLLELAGNDSALRTMAADLSRTTTNGRGLSRQLESAATFAAEPTLLDPAAFVIALRDSLVRLLGDPIELHIQVHPTEFRLRMDRRQLQQIIASLTLLSRDRMPTGGRLTIEMQARSGTADDGRRYMALTLQDTGPLEDRVALADSMVGDLVRMLQGEIRIFAGEIGTVSEVVLPFESVADAAIENDFVEEAKEDVTILVLEADVRLRQLAAGALRRAGYRAIETSEAREALRLARDEGQRIDLVLADVRSARGGRWDLQQKLAAVRPEIKLLYMAALDRETRELLDPSSDFLAKPFSITGVIRMVRAALVDGRVKAGSTG